MKIAHLFETPSHFLSLAPYEFDQKKTGWRGLKDFRQQIEAIKLYLHTYADSNTWRPNTPKSPKSIDPGMLYWHLGQIYAILGDSRNAIQNMEKSRDNESQWDAYVDLTILFLQDNKEEFLNRFRTLGPNSNLDSIKRLKSGIERSATYAQAY